VLLTARYLTTLGHHAGACVLASVGVDDDLAELRNSPSLDAQLTVAGCGRVVTLDVRFEDVVTPRTAPFERAVVRAFRPARMAP